MRIARMYPTVTTLAGGRFGLLVIAVLLVFSSSADASQPEPDDLRPGSPAVVNPAVRSPLQQWISLRGTWDFAIDPNDKGKAFRSGWMMPKSVWPGMRSIEVPGCWEAQGVGKPGMSTTWDIHWDCIPRPMRTIYMGRAWYRRVVAIPENWKGKRLWLKIGGVRAQAWFWVNGSPVPAVNNYCGTTKYDITDLVSPGKEATIVALVRNDLPALKGCMSAGHCFGGLYRDVEIEATPATWIDDVWVQGDFDRRAAVVHVALGSLAALSPQSLVVDVQLKTVDGKPAGRISRQVTLDGKHAAQLDLDVPLAPFRPWSPETPSLYLADVVLRAGDQTLHGWQERFGVRKLEVRGLRFYLNDRPILMRGYGDDFIYPETFVSPASREAHRKHLEMARRSGFVYVRHHTHCELPEFFEAADEAGILIQPELPYYGLHPTEAFPFDPKRDLAELIVNYRRYASLGIYCMGNEGHLGSPLDAKLYQMIKRLDPGRLVLHQDGGINTPANSDFQTGPIQPWKPGSFRSNRAWIAHEYLNLGLKMDPRLDPKFTGAMMPPRDLKSYEAALKDVGLSRAWGDACLDAGHALQRYYQKEGVEAARFDASCGGYCYWTIVDVLVKQGNTYTGQGLFNAFWEPKPGGNTPEDFSKFNGPTALLARLAPVSPIAIAGQTLEAAWWISHFGQSNLKQAAVAWTLRDGKNVLAQGTVENLDIALGDVHELGKSKILIPEVSRPLHAVLEARLNGTDIVNQWDLWLFPKRTTKDGTGLAAVADLYDLLSARYSGVVREGAPGATAKHVLVTTGWDGDARAALEAGRRVVILQRPTSKANVALGWWWLGDQTGTAVAKHPALGQFPHEGYLSPLWFRLVKKGESLSRGHHFFGAEPLMLGEGGNGYFLYMFQAQVGKGRLLRTSGLDVLADLPEAACLLDGLLDYARSENFAPQQTIDLKRLP